MIESQAPIAIHAQRQSQLGTMTPPVSLPIITGDAELDHALYLLALLAVEICEGAGQQVAA